MSQRSVAALRALQDSYYGGAGTPESLEGNVAALRAAAAAVGDTDRVTPQAWLALAEVYRRSSGAWERLAELGDAHPSNPLLQVLVAHGALANFADALKMPSAEFSADVSIMADYAETPEMEQWRGRAATALERAAASPLWALLDQSETVVAYASAVRGMARGKYAETADALAPLIDDPIFGDEAGALAAFASLFAGKSDRAAGEWERVGRRGWSEALSRASIARLFLASSVSGPDADPLAQFERSLRAAQGAESLRPGSSDKIAKVATVYWSRALYRLDHGGDPMADLEAAIATYDRAAAAGPLGVDDFLNMAGARNSWAKLRAARGFDPRPELKRALKDLTQALSLDPEWSSARRALGDIWVGVARYELAYGGDPYPAFEQARVAMETVLERRPDDFPALVGLSNVWRAQADAEAAAGGVRRVTVERGLTPILRAIELNPNQAETLSNAAILWRMLGECRREAGEDPAEPWRQAVVLLERALAIKPGNMGFLNNRALVHRSLGDQQRLSGVGDPTPHYRAAIADLTAAVQAQPNRVVPRHNRAVNYTILAAVMAAQGTDPSAELAAALADFDAVIEGNPNMWQALVARGHLHRRAGRRTQAIADYRATLKVNGKIEEARMWLQRLEQGR
jgi:tetratricopeptide (TPR) repeat protein